MTSRNYGLAGRCALVTGAGQGIGEAISKALAQQGVAVAVNGRTQEKIARVVKEITAAGGRAIAVRAQVEVKAEVTAMVDSVIREFGQIDFLVNNAGISKTGAFVDLPEDAWDTNIDINLKGSFLCSQAVVRHMMVRKSGAIVNLCSIASYGGQEGRVGYASAKSGLLGLTNAMAVELAPLGIRVNAVAPGMIGTEMVARNVPEAFLNDVALDRKPMGRLGEPREVAETILFLLSEGASFITGTTVRVDGGLLSGYFTTHKAGQASFRR